MAYSQVVSYPPSPIFPEEILLNEKKITKGKCAEMTRQAQSKWGGVIAGTVHCPVGHFPMKDCGTQETSRLSFLHSGTEGQMGISVKFCQLLPPLHCFTPVNPLSELLSQRNFSEGSKMGQHQLTPQSTLVFSLGCVTTVQQSCFAIRSLQELTHQRTAV